LLDQLQFPHATPFAMPALPLELQHASSEWPPLISAPSEPPTLPGTVLPSMQDRLERAHGFEAARVKLLGQGRVACKATEEDEADEKDWMTASAEVEEDEEETDEGGEETDDREGGLVASQTHVEAGEGLCRRAISDGQQRALATAAHEGPMLPRQKLPTPLIVRNTFIEAPVALPLSSRFSRLRRASSCPAGASMAITASSAGGQHCEADGCTQSDQEDSEDAASVVAAVDVPESFQVSWVSHMQPMELAALSVGSARHASRRCKPCAFIHTDAGCANGTACPFCHACSPGEKRRRQKVKAQHRKRRLQQQRQATERKEMTSKLQFDNWRSALRSSPVSTACQHAGEGTVLFVS